MNWIKQSSTVYLSECGRYERRESVGPHGKSYFNCWLADTGAYVGAGFKKSEIDAQIEAYEARVK